MIETITCTSCNKTYAACHLPLINEPYWLEAKERASLLNYKVKTFVDPSTVNLERCNCNSVSLYLENKYNLKLTKEDLEIISKLN